MRKPALLFTLLVLGGAAYAADDKALWKAAFQLDEAEHAKSAASLLRSSGAAGYGVLSKMARAGGERMALASAASQIGCHVMIPLPYYSHGMGPELPQSAAKLATEILQEDKALRQAMLGAEEPFDRALALIVSAGVPGAMPEALKRLQNEKAPRVLELVESASRCARMRTGEEVDAEAERLARKLEGSVQQPRCEQAGFVADTLVDGLFKGTYQVSGWSRSNDDFSVILKRGADKNTQLAPPCALALYDALAKRGRYESGLVVPIAQQHLLPISTRDAAARRAMRDLSKYPESNRNKLAAELVNSGYDVPVKVTYRSDDSFAQEAELEAAARQGSQQALVDIERFVFCRGSFGSNGLSLLGYLKTPDAAETAYRLAEQCPHARGSGTAALLRMRDPRGIQFLGAALEGGSFAEEDLNRAVIESYTPELGSELHRLAESDNGYRAKELLRILKLAGVTRD